MPYYKKAKRIYSVEDATVRNKRYCAYIFRRIPLANAKSGMKYLLLGLLFSLSMTGCYKPTYPDKKLVKSIKERVYKEYKLDNIKVEREKNTLWIYIPVEKLVNEKFELSKDALEVIGDVSLVSSRVVFSSDAKIEFIALIAYDQFGIEFKMFRNTEDIKKVQAWYIGYSDFYICCFLLTIYSDDGHNSGFHI